MAKENKFWGFVAQNEKVYEYVKAPSKANAVPAIISAGIIYVVGLSADLTARAIWEGGKWIINKTIKKGNKK